jgi:hypothetical protein
MICECCGAECSEETGAVHVEVSETSDVDFWICAACTCPYWPGVCQCMAPVETATVSRL